MAFAVELGISDSVSDPLGCSAGDSFLMARKGSTYRYIYSCLGGYVAPLPRILRFETSKIGSPRDVGTYRVIISCRLLCSSVC